MTCFFTCINSVVEECLSFINSVLQKQVVHKSNFVPGRGVIVQDSCEQKVEIAISELNVSYLAFILVEEHVCSA
jgi:phosphoribosylamine-glycine ligase